MNTLPEPIITMLFAFAAPLTSGVVCLIIIAVFLAQSKDRQSRQIARVLICELSVCVFCWFSLICFIIAPRAYTSIEFLFILSILYAQVFTYRIIFLHTRLKANEPFSRWHYLLPLIPATTVLIYSENDEVEETIDDKAHSDRKVNKEQFERFMRLKKPYLNSELRITDLTYELHTNRTYLSAFINKEYGMNFSRHINIRRLEELKRMSTDPRFAHMNGRDLVVNVGFSNYRGYLRFKKEEDKRSQIAIDR